MQDWRPQIFSCGLSERLDRFQYVGNIDHVADQTRELLESVGLWESHGKRFINGGVKKWHMCSIKSHPLNETLHIGFQQKDEIRNSLASNTAYGHSKGSKNKMDEYYTPELLKKVREELYANDYKVYQLLKEKETLSSGKEIAAQLSTRCANS